MRKVEPLQEPKWQVDVAIQNMLRREKIARFYRKVPLELLKLLKVEGDKREILDAVIKRKEEG